jgi:MFS family permease
VMVAAVCALVTASGVISAFTSTYIYLLLARLAVGIGVGGLVVPFDLLTELLPASARGSFLIYMRLFWTLGSIYIAGSSAIFLDLTSWRTIACLAAIPVALAGLLAACFAPESPHWLLANNRARDAEDTIK